MKKKVLNSGIVLTVLMALSALSSCIDGDEKIHVSYGVIRNVVSNSSYEILTDRGNTLTVTKSVSSQEIEDGKRVLANFEILSDREESKKRYEVKMNGFYFLLSKPPVHESFILENETARRDSIGSDPFVGIDAWFGGDYININFETFFDELSGKKHLINLVYDDTKTSADTLYLTLYQNSYGETPNSGSGISRLRTGIGRCSFKLSDLLPAGVNEKPVKLQWKKYSHDLKAVDCSDTGVFKKGNYDGGTEKSNANAGLDGSLKIN